MGDNSINNTDDSHKYVGMDGQTTVTPTLTKNGMTYQESTRPAKKVRRKGTISYIRGKIVSGLETIFYRFGVFVASNPFVIIPVAIVIPALLTIGMGEFKLHEDFADLLLPPASRIHEDRAWVQRHVSFEQRVIRLIVQSENVLSPESLLQLYDFHARFSNLTAGEEDYASLCVRINRKCFVESVMALWQNERETIEKLTQEEILHEINTVTQNPMYFFDFNITRLVSDITRDDTGYIVGAGIMHADWFLQSSEALKPTVKDFEYKAIDVALEPHPHFSFVTVFTIDSYDDEFFKGVYGDIILIVYGFPVVLLYIILSLGNCNLVEHAVYLAGAAILGVALSAGACYGIGLAAGLYFGAPHQALIFLLLAVGVDNAFVISTRWKQVNEAHGNLPIVERVGLTMQHAGVSVSVTSFSDIVAFACGISTQMPLLRSFCVYCSIGIAFLFLLQSTLFPAVLALNQRRIEASRDACIPCVQYLDYKPSSCSRFEVVGPFFEKVFTPALLSIPGKVIVLLMTVGLIATMSYGISQIRKGYEIERSLPEDSYVRKFLEAQRLYFSQEGPGIQVFCSPMDYQKNLKAINTMAETYANSSVILYGLVANWIPFYQLYIGSLNLHQGANIPVNEDGVPADEDEFYLHLQEFMKHPFGIPFSKYVEFTDDKDSPRIKWAYFPMQQIVSQDVWRNEFIMEEVRRIADDTQLDNGKCFVYSVFHIFTEVIRYVDEEITRNFVLAGCAVFLVTLILIADLVTSFFVFVCVVLTMVDIMGSLHFWDFYLDVNVVVLLIISIGLAVDFSAHIGYTFMTVTGTRNERAKKTICHIGPAVFHGAFTTFLVFFVLIFGKSLSLFFATFILVVLYGLFHGMCFLPVILSLIGPEPYDSVDIDQEVTVVTPTQTPADLPVVVYDSRHQGADNPVMEVDIKDIQCTTDEGQGQVEERKVNGSKGNPQTGEDERADASKMFAMVTTVLDNQTMGMDKDGGKGDTLKEEGSRKDLNNIPSSDDKGQGHTDFAKVLDTSDIQTDPSTQETEDTAIPNQDGENQQSPGKYKSVINTSHSQHPAVQPIETTTL